MGPRRCQRAAFAVLGLLLVTSHAVGDEHADLAACAAIGDDARRLECYDALARAGGVLAGTPVGDWSLASTAGEVSLERPADREAHGHDHSQRPVLVLSCRDRELDVRVRTGMAAQEEHGGPGKTVLLRFDQEQPFSERLAESAARDALIFPDALMVASQLRLHHELFFQFMPSQSRPADVIFDLRGLEPALPPLFEACGLVVAEDGLLEQQARN